jgi:hypothetical protein
MGRVSAAAQHSTGSALTLTRAAAPARSWVEFGRALLLLGLALCGSKSAHAQPPAVAHLSPPTRVVRYAPNESGGRITITFPGGDSSGVETIRLELLEAAAAIRRGDFRKLKIVRTDLPAIKVLTAGSARIRCTYRPTTKGGELVLLSDDDAVVRAIHQVLATEPPETG